MTWFGFPLAAFRAMRLISKGRGNILRFRRKCSRASRLMRLRSTAPPTLRLTVTPKRDSSPRLGATTATNSSERVARPVTDKPTYSDRFRIRSIFWKENLNSVIALQSIGWINRPSGCGPWRGADSGSGVRSWWTCVYGIRDCALCAAGWAERVFSWQHFLLVKRWPATKVRNESIWKNLTN